MSSAKRSLVDSLDAHLSRVSRDELRARLEGVSRLLDVVRVLAADVDVQRIAATITHEAETAFRCQQARLFQYDAHHNQLVIPATPGHQEHEIRCGTQRGVIGHVARHGELVNLAHPAHDPRWDPAIDQPEGMRAESMLAAPLSTPHQGSLLGILQVINRRYGPFDELDQHLFMAYCQHAAVALDRVQMVEQLGNQRSVEVSLEVARNIQRGFMPNKVPDIAGYQVSTWWLANEAVGGDYCDVIPLRNGRIGLSIADVSGHGLGPSLIMATARAALHALVLDHTEPEVLLNLLARAISQDLRDGRFITMLLAVLDPLDHSVQYANAGHGPALHYVSAIDEFDTLETTGTPLGVIVRPSYHQGWPLTMEIGDILILATDGIVEAMDDAGHRFGIERLQSLVRRCRTLPVDGMVQQLADAVQAHCAGNSPPDDLTILVLRRTY